MGELRVKIRHCYRSGFTLDLDFRTEAMTTAVFGPSGSGKTTLLSMLSGMMHPDEGLIILGDEVLLDTARKYRLPPEKRRIGFVFQDHLLFPHLTVEKNLRYGLDLKRVVPENITFEKVVAILELGELLKQLPRTLSGGQQQRVALGRALLSGPKLLLMDEPLTALDDALKARVIEYLERVIDQWKIPTMYVSHNIFEVRRLAERVIIFSNGQVSENGLCSEILKQNFSDFSLKKRVLA